MEAKEFFNKLKTILSKEVGLKDDYHNNTKWTDRIKRITKNIVGEDNISWEYYRVDTLKYAYTNFYKDFENNDNKKYFDGAKKSKFYLNVYNWKNSIAIEYENDCHSWTDELVKLCHLRSDLKVIIAYSEWDGSLDNYRLLTKQKVDFAIELIKHCQEDALNDKWLIVFGPCNGGKVFDNCLADCFIGYEMINQKFVPIGEN